MEAIEVIVPLFEVVFVVTVVYLLHKMTPEMPLILFGVQVKQPTTI